MAELRQRIDSSDEGLASGEARTRLEIYGRNELHAQRPLSRLGVLAEQLRNPLLLILVFAAAISVITGEWGDAGIVILIVAASVGLGYSREYSAQAAAVALRARVRTCTNTIRDGRPQLVPAVELVPGDIILLSAGSLVPADGCVLSATDFYVNEAVLTGESFPVRKFPGPVATESPLGRRTNCVHMGTNVRSGTARCIIVKTGGATEFGHIARRLVLQRPETEFNRGLAQFGTLLTSAMMVMVLLVFLVHVIEGRPPIETLLFAIALAVGLSPELLPAILNVNLARGAKLMAEHGVIVKHLSAIENLGSMDILCTDKTGTLTEGVVELAGAWNPEGTESRLVLELAATNAALQTGLENPLDPAILKAKTPDPGTLNKLGEIPYDFVRKRVSVIIGGAAAPLLITKGAFAHVIDACTRISGAGALSAAQTVRLRQMHDAWSADGIRVIALATRELPPQPVYSREDERDLCFEGFLCFQDRPKAGVAETLADLGNLGVATKIITGDNRLVAQHVARQVGMRADRILTGAELDILKDEALWREAERTDLFVEVDPNQKERIILSLRKMGHVVGFLGDGVNDAPAMHAADTSLSVEQAVDVAREAADFILLERNLDALHFGILEGRRTFANTLKYILTTTSANLGNMVSMVVISPFLPFLPLLAGQILLNNFLSDVPAVGIADDSVDPEMVNRPQRWNMHFIGRFMVEFGILSSLFDFIAFGTLLFLFHATPELFHTGWFVESLLTELVIALVVRTRRPCFRSRPGNLLTILTIAMVVLAVAIPYMPWAALLGFVPLPGKLLLTLLIITGLYVVAAEITKRWFYRNHATPG